MKAYFDGGLRDTAKKAGYTEEILNSIAACGKFKRTNKFLLKAWESILKDSGHFCQILLPIIQMES